MTVPSNWHGRPRQRWRMPLSALTMLALATLSAAATPVAFDEKLNAPMMQDAAKLQSTAKSFSAKFARLRAASPEQIVRNPALAREQFDLTWTITKAIDTGRPLPDLTEVGIVANPDGGVIIDSNAFPQWLPIDERISTLLPAWDMAAISPELMRRGFRTEDIAQLQEYLAAHDVERAAAKRALPVALAFNKVVAKYDRLKLKIDISLVMSFFYQQARQKSEARREWTLGLLDALDAQRGRILIEFISEFKTTTLWTPEDQSIAIEDLLTKMRRTDFAQRATAEAQGVRP